MRILVIVAAGALATLAAKPLGASPSGVQGHVTRGPLTPVCRADTPCSGPAARVKLVFTRGDSTRSVTTDRSGRYVIRLSAGTWSVRIPQARFGFRPRTVAVRAGVVRVQNFFIDTGIR